jgi:hypothetical protein
MLSFHRVREAIVAGIVTFHCLTGDDNPADILSKQWGYTQIKERLKASFFCKGDTADFKKERQHFRQKGSVKFLVHRRVEYQAFPDRHSTAINRNGKACLLKHS